MKRLTSCDEFYDDEYEGYYDEEEQPKDIESPPPLIKSKTEFEKETAKIKSNPLIAAIAHLKDDDDS